MEELEADLSAYYDQEASERAGRPIEAARAQRRVEFAAQLMREGRGSLLEIGTGPGRDAAEFLADGFEVSGIDLSLNHARLAHAEGVGAVQASLFALPFLPTSFDAGWTMSTLVHVPDTRFDAAMRSLTAALRPGAPLAVGLWGGIDREFSSNFDHIKPPRFFSLRSHQRARDMLSAHGRVERFDTWTHGTIDWEYQFAIVRVDG